MQLNPYLSFDGQCEAAFRFYEQALGGKIIAMLTFADTPMAEQVAAGNARQDCACASRRRRQPPDGVSTRGRLGHHEKMKGFWVTLGTDEPAEAERVFAALAAGGTVDDADRGDVLGASLRHADRPLRHALDDQL